MAQLSTEHFTEAMRIAHAEESPDITSTLRTQAAQYLVALKESNDGLNLAYSIISSEAFDGLRVFWAFNTFIFHLPLIATQVTSEQSEELYRALSSWMRSTICGEVPLPDYVLNKHAQVMVIGLHAFYPERWSAFFTDLFVFLELRDRGGGDQVIIYFLRVFQYIDEVVVDRQAQRDQNQRARDMKIKDAMREGVNRTAVNVWYNLLAQYHSKAIYNRPGSATGFRGTDRDSSQNATKDISRHVLYVVQSYVEWIEISYLLTAEWVQMLYFLLQSPALRVGSCEVLIEIVDKKQAPRVKWDTLLALRVPEIGPKLVADVMRHPPTTEEEEAFLCAVTRLVVGTAREIVNVISEGIHTVPFGNEMAAMLAQLIPHILELMKVQLFSVRELLLPFLQTYLKTHVPPAAELPSLLQAVYYQSCFPSLPGSLEDEQTAEASVQGSTFEERVVEQRKLMYVLIKQLIFRRDHALVLGFCCSAMSQLLQKIAQNEIPSEEEAEGALRLVYEMGSSLRLDIILRDAPPQAQSSTTSQQIVGYEIKPVIQALLQSAILSVHPSPAVHLAFFELFDRYAQYFVHYRAEAPTLLHHFLQCPSGVGNSNPRVRGQICKIFNRMSTPLKQVFSEYAQQIVQAAIPYVSSEQSILLPSDRCDVYEALGLLLATCDITTCGAVIQAVLDHIHGVLNADPQGQMMLATLKAAEDRGEVPSALPEGVMVSEPCAGVIGEDIGYLTALAKGIGGVEATRAPESPPLSPGDALPTPPTSMLPPAVPVPSMTSTVTAGDGEAPTTPHVAAFHTVMKHVTTATILCLQHASVRDKAVLFMQQIINVLGTEGLPSVGSLLHRILSTSNNAGDLSRTLRVVFQTVNKMRGAAAEMMGTALLPLIILQVEACCGQGMENHQLNLTLNVLSESARELLEVYRNYFTVLHSVVVGSCIAALQYEPMAPHLETVMNAILSALRPGVDLELMKQAVQILTRLTAVWCEENTSIEEFVFVSALPLALDTFSSSTFDLKDPKHFMVVGELAGLLRVILSKLPEGNRGMMRIYSIIVSGGWSEANDAQNFCNQLHQMGQSGPLQISGAIPVKLKMMIRSFLEHVQSRRVASAVTAAAAVAQQ